MDFHGFPYMFKRFRSFPMTFHCPSSPAEVAVEALLDLLQRGRLRALQRAVERHDDARRAEAALRAVLLGDAPLHRVRLCGCADALHGHHMAAVHTAQRRQAGVHRPVAQGAIEGAHGDGAGAATALATAQLRTYGRLFKTKKIY